MRRLALVAALLLATPGPAHAATYAWHGGCNFATLAAEVVVAGHHTGDRDRWTGVAYAHFAFTDDSSPTTPVGATVRCVLLLNGTEAWSTTPVHGTGAVAFAEPLTFRATPYDVVTFCDDITYDDGQHVFHCPVDLETPLVPQPITDLVADTGPVVADAVCPVTGDTEVTHELFGVYAEPWRFEVYCAP